MMWIEIYTYTHTHTHTHANAHAHTDRSLNEVDTGLKIQTEVNEFPLYALSLVLLLLQYKHGVIEQLL